MFFIIQNYSFKIQNWRTHCKLFVLLEIQSKGTLKCQNYFLNVPNLLIFKYKFILA